MYFTIKQENVKKSTRSLHYTTLIWNTKKIIPEENHFVQSYLKDLNMKRKFYFVVSLHVETLVCCRIRK